MILKFNFGINFTVRHSQKKTDFGANFICSGIYLFKKELRITFFD